MSRAYEIVVGEVAEPLSGMSEQVVPRSRMQLKGPAVVGSNATVTVRELPAGIVCEPPLPVTTNSGHGETTFTSKSAVPTLRITKSRLRVVPATMLPKSRLVGSTSHASPLIGFRAMPVRDTV